MANLYKNSMFDLTTTDKTTVYTCPTDRTALIKTIQVTNIHTGANEVEVFTTDASNSNAEHEIAHISLASKTVDNLAKGTIVLESADTLKLKAETANDIAGIISILELFDEKKYIMQLVQIPKQNIEEVWHIVVKDIADALARSNGYALADHIKKWILEEKMQLWILWSLKDKQYYGTVVTEIIQRPLQRCLNIKIMTGKHREKWQHLIKHIEDFAWQNKCDLLELVARPGWKKVLKPFGYKESHILLEKKRRNKLCHQEEGGNTTTTTQAAQPYAPAEPALQQIISEAGTIYGQGPTGAGYVAPTQQTLQGLAAQETMAGAANQQILDTIQGQYTNPFLSPMIAQAGKDIYSSVAGQFSGAGRTPGSPLMQSQVIGQVADKAMPLAFQQLERERNRQLSTAQRVPSLTAVGGALEDIQRQQQMAPQQSLAQYYNTVAPIAYGLPTQQQTSQAPAPNAFGMAAGGAMTGASMGSMFGGPAGAMTGAAIGGLGGLLGGLL